MKLSFRLYRTVTLPMADLMPLCGSSRDLTVGEMEAVFRQEFYPFAPRFKVFWPESMIVPSEDADTMPILSKIVFGMEMMAFDVSCEKVPVAGLTSCDPMDPTDVARADGALRSEMERLGMSCEIDEFDWRVAYELKGN